MLRHSYVFTRQGSVWVQRVRLTAATLRVDAYLGTSIAFANSGRLLLAGAPGDDSSGASRGAVYAWELQGASASDVGATWTPLFR